MVKKILGRSYIVLILLFIYVPIFYLILFSFTSSKLMGQWTGFSFKLYADLFTGSKSAEIMSALKNTLLVGLTSSLVATALGSLTAIGLHSSGRKMKAIVQNANQIPILNAEIVTAVALLLFFTTIGMNSFKGFWTVTLSHIMFCTPYVVLSVLPRLKSMNNNVYEAALDLGATPWSAIMKVVLPEILPGMISGFLLAFTLSVDDFVITQFTTTSNFQTLSTYIYNTYSGKDGMPPELRALSCLLFVVVLLVLVLLNVRAGKKRDNA